MMKKLGPLLILLSLGFSNNLIDDVITNNGVQYYSRPYVEEIIDTTVAESFSNNVDRINDLKANLLEMQLGQMTQISNIKRSYEREISILKQSHQLELKAEKLKGQMRIKGFFFGGLFTGIGGSVGTALFVNSFDFPLFKFTF